MTIEESRRFLRTPLYFGAFMVASGEAAGMVAGLETPAPDVLHAALQIIGPRKGIDTVSSSFILLTDMLQFGMMVFWSPEMVTSFRRLMNTNWQILPAAVLTGHVGH